MKKLLLITTILLSTLSVNADSRLQRTYIVNEDGTVTFLNRVIPKKDEAGRIYIMNEDGTITFLNREAPEVHMNEDQFENIRMDIANFLDRSSLEMSW